jgi:hypothetical protein
MVVDLLERHHAAKDFARRVVSEGRDGSAVLYSGDAARVERLANIFGKSHCQTWLGMRAVVMTAQKHRQHSIAVSTLMRFD